MLNAHQITVSFGGETLFDEISFRLGKGDRVGLIGKMEQENLRSFVYLLKKIHQLLALFPLKKIGLDAISYYFRLAIQIHREFVRIYSNSEGYRSESRSTRRKNYYSISLSHRFWVKAFQRSNREEQYHYSSFSNACSLNIRVFK